MTNPYSGGSSSRPSAWWLWWFLLATPLAMGQVGPVRDIFPKPTPAVLFNGKLYFAASSAATGTELYRSNPDGTSQELVRDLFPGTGDGLGYSTQLVVMNAALYLTATEGTGGYELWKSDGTAAGTVRVKDIHPGAGSSAPLWLTAVNGTLYFSAAAAGEDRDLWKSNGTAAGTVLVKDLAPGPDGAPPIHDLVNLNGTLFFATGGALWKSNGTAAGTVVVKNLTGPQELTACNGALYFSAYDASVGRELWRSNGTEAGTAVVKDILDGYREEDGSPRSSEPHRFQVVGNALYFVALANLSPYSIGPLAERIFWTDGTAEGTQDVGGAVPLSTRLSQAELTDVEVVGESIYYSIFTYDLQDGFYIKLMKIDAEGTSQVMDFSYTDAPVTQLTNVNGVLYFTTGEGGGPGIWRTDGTQAGTFTLPAFDPAYGALYDPTNLFALGNFLYFNSSFGSDGPALWRYNLNGPITGALGINAGGPAYTEVLVDSQGRTFPGFAYQADAYFTGGSVFTYPDPGTLSNLRLYLNTRWGQFSYNVPVANGPYEVVLEFAEMYWGNGRAGGVGSRKFHVDVEGTRKLTDYDIFARAGGAAKSVSEPVTAEVTDGVLNIAFVKGSADNPVVSAIRIIQRVPLQGVPVLAPIGNKTVEAGKTLTFTAAANANGAGPLTYSLEPRPGGYAFPTGATIDPATGVFAWKPGANLTGAYHLVVKVSSNGTPAFSDREEVSICVLPRTDLTVLGASACGIADANGFTFQALVTIKNSQPGVLYSVYREGTQYGSWASGTGGDVQISFPFTSTQAAPVTYSFDVRATGCGIQTVTLAQKAQFSLVSDLLVPTAAGKTISSGQTATLTASTTQAGVTSFRWYAAATGSTALFTGASFTTPALTATTSYYVAAVYGGCQSSRRLVQVVVSGGAPPTLRVNAGGNAFSTLDARSFTADAYFSGGVVSTVTTLGIAGTADDYLYQTGRHGASFAYNFPVSNGAYDVVLHFAETYYGNTAPGGVGSRKFHVNLEGARKLTDYDIFARAGGALRVAQETFRVNVADGTLTVSFLKGAADNPAVKAIEVLPAGSALTINSGGGAFTAVSGRRFSADVYYASGSVSGIASGEIANTSDDALYRNARVGVFSYGLPSGNGTFDVTLHFAETYWGSRAAGGVGSRKFNVFVEGVRRLSDYDVFAKAGGAMRAVRETVRVTVSDGVLNLYFAKGTADNPMLSALEVVPVTAAAREVAAGESSAQDGPVRLFPNPVQDKLLVSLPFPAERVRGTAVTDASGAVHQRDAHAVNGPQELRLETGRLPKGLYLLRLDTENGPRVVKFVKQ